MNPDDDKVLLSDENDADFAVLDALAEAEDEIAAQDTGKISES